MYLKSKLSWNVIIPAENLNENKLMLEKAIILHLLGDFSAKKVMKDLGYFMAVSTIDKIGEGTVRQQYSGDVLFPVEFSCITFKIFRGEILEGVVYRITKQGVLLRCGPMEKIFLSHKMMTGFTYVPGENPMFIHDTKETIEKDVVVRFIVMGEKYLEAEKEFSAIASIEGDYLGPICKY